jgi:hypothetical protein
MSRDLPVAPNLRVNDVLALFDLAVREGDLERASAWADLVLRRNDDRDAARAADGLARLFAEAIDQRDLEQADAWADEWFKRQGAS